MAATSAAPGATAGRDRPGTAEEARLAHAAAARRRRRLRHALRPLREPDLQLLPPPPGLPRRRGRRDAGGLPQGAPAPAEARGPRAQLLGLPVHGRPQRLLRHDRQAQARRADRRGARAAAARRSPATSTATPSARRCSTSLQDDVREANGRLPERQREVLALRELEELSYDEIAEIMEHEPQLGGPADLARADQAPRRAAGHGAGLDRRLLAGLRARAGADRACARTASSTTPSDRAWLAEHLAACETCRVAQEAIQEAGISYRAWLPILPAAWLWHATAARAAELVGADWSHLVREHSRPTARRRRRSRRPRAAPAGSRPAGAAPAPRRDDDAAGRAGRSPSSPPTRPRGAPAAGRRAARPDPPAGLLHGGGHRHGPGAPATVRHHRRRELLDCRRPPAPPPAATASRAEEAQEEGDDHVRQPRDLLHVDAELDGRSEHEHRHATTGTPRRRTAPPAERQLGRRRGERQHLDPDDQHAVDAAPRRTPRPRPCGGTPLRRRHPERGRHAAHPDRAADRPRAGHRPAAAALTRATGERGESPLHCAAIGR